jgi:hypothetical protein
MSLKDLVAAIQLLSPSERNELSARLSFLTTKNADPESDENERLLYEVIAEQLASRGVKAPPLSVYARTGKHYRRFTENAQAFALFIDERVQPQRKPLRRRAYELAVSSLLRRLEAAGVPLSVGAVALGAVGLSREFGRMFPGYASAGLLAQVLGQA